LLYQRADMTAPMSVGKLTQRRFVVEF